MAASTYNLLLPFQVISEKTMLSVRDVSKVRRPFRDVPSRLPSAELFLIASFGTACPTKITKKYSWAKKLNCEV